MRIQHNIMAMNAYRNYNTNTSALSKNLEKLSSGYKINRAGDDAAGLAISEKMRAQITGLNAAQKNVKDGISLVKTAEGAMQEIQDMLNRMDYLATQSANGTYDDPVDRANLQKEVNALKTEIDRIADSANFNGINLLDGSWAKTVTSDNTGVDTGKYDFGEALSLKKVYTAASAADATKTSDSIDGATPTAATKATATIKLKAGVTLADLASIETGLTYTDASGALATYTFGDLFDITIGEDEYTDGDVTEATTKITLTAKTAGSVGTAASNALASALKGITSFACASNVAGATGGATGSYFDLTNAVKFKDGTDEGAAGSADNTAAVYKVTLDLGKVNGGSKFMIGGQTVEFVNSQATTANYQISLFGLDKDKLAAADSTEVQKLVDRINDALSGLDGSGAAGNATAWEFEEGKISGSEYSFTLTAGDNILGTPGNKDTVDVLSTEGGITVKDETPGLDGPSSPAGGQQVTAGYAWKPGTIKAGDVIQIGGKWNIEVMDDAEFDKNAAENRNAGKIKKSEVTNADALNKALELLGAKDSVHVSAVDGSGIQLQSRKADDTKAEDWAKGDGMLKIGTLKPEPEEPEEPAEPVKGGKALTLQIGDTAEKYNQLEVNIGDMHVKAMGFELDKKGNITSNGKSIQDIDISSLEGAQEAISTIKNAINYVSSIRGDLGATQNRLEHTANNLSVMAENIQDAESTIRDTDVAEEMMAYTKNNILIQSAQAMLAQANAVPQGVLQLLG